MVTFIRPGPIAIIAVSTEGADIGRRLLALPQSTLYTSKPFITEATTYSGTMRDLIGLFWSDHAAIIGVMASGILVRSIAPWVETKYADPAVIAVDDAARFAISLMSGHEGGANRLAEQIGEILGAIPVITTGSEAKRRLIIGIGCRRGVSAAQIIAVLDQALAEHGHTREEIYAVATIDLKADEPGLREAAAQLGVPVRIVPRSRIRTLQETLRAHTFAETITGVAAICIPSALLTSPHSELLAPNLALNGVTIALAQDTCGWWESAPEGENT